MRTHHIVDNITGAPSEHTVAVGQKDGYAVFTFQVKTDAFCLPQRGYNSPIYEGDVVEVFIASDDPAHYIEAELSPAGDVFLANIHNADGQDELTVSFVERSDCFIQTSVQHTADGYLATIAFPLQRLGENATFNAFVISRESAQPYFALFPTGVPRFHRPAKFQQLNGFLK